MSEQECPGFIVTRAAKRFGHRAVALATGSIRCLLAVSESGSGKTATARWAVQKLLSAWPYPIGYYTSRMEGDRRERFDLASMLEFAEEIGLVTAETRPRAAEILGRRFPACEGESASGPAFCYWLDWLADHLGKPRPDALTLAPLRGIVEEPKWRYPALITGMIMETPRSLAMKMAEAMGIDDAPEMQTGQRYAYLQRVLRKMPMVPFFDEVDNLPLECIRMSQQVCEESGTPFCLLGTPRLVGRLLRDPRLRPIATRVEARVDLGRVTAADLQAAFPQIPSDSILVAWAASGKNWRIAAHIIQRLEEVRRDRPGARIGKRLVAAVIQQVLAARAIELGADDLEEAEGLMSGAMPQTSAVTARRSRGIVPAVEEDGEAVAPMAVRAAGQSR